MRKRLYEIMGIQPQYHEDGPPEYPAPPDEFNRFAPADRETERESSRVMRTMLLLGFTGLSVVSMLFSHANASAGDAEPIAEIVSASETGSPSPDAAVLVTGSPAPTEEPRQKDALSEPQAAAENTPSPAPTDAPSQAPTDTPSPAPTDTPAPKETPAIEAVYFCFSAEYHLHLKLSDAEELSSCEVAVTDRTLGLDLFRHTLTEAELSAGEYEMEPFWINDYYFEHLPEWEALGTEPVPVLTVTAVYGTLDGEKTLTEEKEASYETGWTVRYDAPDAEKNEYTYPGFLYFGTYEEFGQGPLVAVNDPSAAEKGGISISVAVGGIPVSPETCEVKERALTFFDEPTGYYSTYVLIPIPENAPEHGTAHFTVTQKLYGYGIVVTFERDVEY